MFADVASGENFPFSLSRKYKVRSVASEGANGGVPSTCGSTAATDKFGENKPVFKLEWLICNAGSPVSGRLPGSVKSADSQPPAGPAPRQHLRIRGVTRRIFDDTGTLRYICDPTPVIGRLNLTTLFKKFDQSTFFIRRRDQFPRHDHRSTPTPHQHSAY